MAFNVWEHMFVKGEFPAREKLLSGLSLEDVTKIPDGMPHSIYQELWHLNTWQEIVIEEDKDDSKHAAWEKGIVFPPNELKSIDVWNEEVERFKRGIKKIMEFSSVPENLDITYEDGLTARDSLMCLAVHNTVHFGKILAMRQMIGAWPPAEVK